VDNPGGTPEAISAYPFVNAPNGGTIMGTEQDDKQGQGGQQKPSEKPGQGGQKPGQGGDRPNQ